MRPPLKDVSPASHDKAEGRLSRMERDLKDLARRVRVLELEAGLHRVVPRKNEKP